jgi:hypothetical protein
MFLILDATRVGRGRLRGRQRCANASSRHEVPATAESDCDEVNTNYSQLIKSRSRMSPWGECAALAAGERRRRVETVMIFAPPATTNHATAALADKGSLGCSQPRFPYAGISLLFLVALPRPSNCLQIPTLPSPALACPPLSNRLIAIHPALHRTAPHRRLVLSSIPDVVRRRMLRPHLNIASLHRQQWMQISIDTPSIAAHPNSQPVPSPSHRITSCRAYSRTCCLLSAMSQAAPICPL